MAISFVCSSVYAEKLVWSISETDEGTLETVEPEISPEVPTGPSPAEQMFLDRFKSLSKGLDKMPAPPSMENKEIDIPVFDLKPKKKKS